MKHIFKKWEKNQNSIFSIIQSSYTIFYDILMFIYLCRQRTTAKLLCAMY